MKNNKKKPLASVVINNHNYGHFLPESIDSAIHQTYPNVEIVVVDDGSVDSSSRVISGYGKKLRPVYKDAGGQASAMNAGVAASCGELLFFLDADDIYHRDKVEQMVSLHQRKAVLGPSMISHRLRNFGSDVDPHSYRPDKFWHITKGRRRPGSFDQLCDPALAYSYAREHAFVPYLASPTSGISIARSLADLVFPLPEIHQVGADCLLARAAILTGNVFGADRVHARRRIHQANHSTYAHKHMNNEVFLKEMDQYLNRLLLEQGKAPVISFFESRSAERFHRVNRSCAGLLRVAFKAYHRNRSAESLRFALRLGILAVNVAREKYIAPSRGFARPGLSR